MGGARDGGEARDDARGKGAAIAVVVLLAGVFAITQGLSYPLLALVLERQGVSSALIGLNTAMTPLGLLVSAPLLPLLARRIGPVRVALSSALAVALLLALIGSAHNLWIWFPARFLLGFAIDGLYIICETWINQLAPPARRGRVLGLFSSVLAAGFASGPLIVALAGSRGWTAFLIGIAIALVSAVLVFAARHRLPGLEDERPASLLAFLPQAPLLLLLVGAAAAFDQAVLSLLPVYGLRVGLGEALAAGTVGVLAIGNVLFQLPIGWLADAWSRRGATLLLCALTVAGAALLPAAGTDPWALWPLLFVWGSAAYGIYTLALIQLGDRFGGTLLLAGNAAFALLWGLGGLAGPPLAGAAMDRLGPGGLPLVLGLLYAGVFAVVAVRRSA
ncbi:Predicted arabinose efflux permease, MFS family [Tistlia consotensis]|uniref:Predicted arabinose efflux permease, MFS family n=1 Tax=Tistlia consotensis USBA 355 TaxID=560819 RepID=A0A1Y6BLT3_9PROT|nr:MFS transporter [Tistlia consotensis]SMF14132.1 Predicted arabinose efflux permease, MFS family [Tistlia consotensis USBA 355]SNR49861.1 Predicted arabinose efflux permease, MFS family [Tistlia consotensis]